MSTPSLTIRTAIIHLSSDSVNLAMRSEDPASSDNTTTGELPVIRARIPAYARASCWSDAMIRPPASGIPA